MAPLENIPSLQGRPGVKEAMQLVVAAVEEMEPDGQLAERWDELRGLLLGWAKNENPIAPEALHGMRLTLEQVCGDQETGDMLVAATKLAISAVLTAVPNIYYIVLEDRDDMHDDIAPLVEKGVNLLHKARATEPFDPTVRVDYAIEAAVEAKKKEHQARMEQEQKQDWVGELIAHAVRPGSEN